MSISILKNKILIDFSYLDEFVKSSERSAGKSAKFVYFSFDGSSFNMYCSGDSSYSVTSIPVSSSVDPFTVGINSLNFFTVCKRLYEGEVELKIDKAKLHIKKGNISVKLAIVARKSYIPKLDGVNIPERHVGWFVEAVSSVLNIDDSLKNAGVQFPGILFDNSEVASRLCKFSRTSLAFRSGNPIFGSKYRVVLQDEIVGYVKSLGKLVADIFINEKGLGFRLKSGTKAFFSFVYDKYPYDYVKLWGLKDDISLLDTSNTRYEFVNNSLYCAGDFVASVLGDLDHFIIFETIGSTEVDQNLVWELSGKAFDGTAVSEKVLSSFGPHLDKFQLNKKAFLKLLSTFGEEVFVCDLNDSVIALSNADGTALALLSKAVV